MAEKAIVGDYEWLVERPAPQRKTRKKVVSAERTSKFDPAVEVLIEVECFQLFLSVEIFYNILTFSNKKIAKKHKIKDNLLPKHIYRFVGIFIYMGAHHNTKNPIEELWSMEDGKAIYKAAISRDMFNLEFDDEKFRILSEKQLKKSVRVKKEIDLKENYLVTPAPAPNESDRFALIRVILDKFIFNLVNQKYYTLSNFVLVDEHLCSFKGKMWAKVFIKSKPGRYGIKFWVCSIFM
ncbi:hypothetical protein EIN_271240 [Entamoeba invadens IP1]|uniref:PiggyBac transposable element-derived protein domain-containing protein n=1 Tax=Entamoeba invadens IP1 TaxID=370355 RepID=A0A0A1UC57_ENTIV|nr:hypothetical protein EIN_271240 [Entamoeba invadens IP1]ELP89849.1 hypothetical protein EIN_271240 [Entamoeba invadens IP1]|eukprot:XP_004256620.1 hypothetical protein EIN_271240 [Entamoeba invadens IP1]